MSKFIIFYLCVLIHNANLMDVTYYEILGVSKQAATQEIKQAYKKLAVKYHPDKNSDETTQEKFLKITEAYETLKDPEKRRKYDVYGSHAAYTKKYDHQTQSEYDNLFKNGLYHNDPYVVSLSSTNFFSYLSGGLHFINFYSPFCPPCHRLVDHWKRFAETYQGIVKVSAVNCKYHKSFCINTMSIGSHPTLVFFLNGVHGNFIHYEGEDTFDGLEKFMMKYLKNKIHVPIISQLRSLEKPVAYVLDTNVIEDRALTRIAYRLKGLVTVVMIDDEDLRDDLSEDPDVTVVFQYKNIYVEISSTDEKTIIKQIAQSLPVGEIDPEKFKNIRNKLRSCGKKSWVIYFPSKDDDNLLLHQFKIKFPDLNFGTIDCISQEELCASLQIESTPCWALLKGGGAYQRSCTHPETFIQNSADAYNLHTLSTAEIQKIMDGRAGTWVLLVVPHNASWEHLAKPFTDASKYYLDKYINFGIMECSLQTARYCGAGQGRPAVLLQQGADTHLYKGELNTENLADFIQLIKDSGSTPLPPPPESAKMYLPADCGQPCRDLQHQWRIIARRLRPLQDLRVGVLQCAEPRALCANVRAPSARLYLVNNKQHYTLNLQQKSEAPYILEWVLDHLDKSVTKLTWHSFANQVLAHDFDPQMYKRPWLVYFQSPQCYHCLEKYPDFALASIFMGKVVNFGKVNCASERNLCQQEHITSQPTLRLYIRSQQGYKSVSLDLDDYNTLMDEVRPYLPSSNLDGLLASLYLSTEKMLFKHDEL
ncbi:PREDICTED: dnaJ homolog subfamily C member 10-like [Papilio polytes]|uniref:dnaJ homolog subfamily C member 10-like n=1 Tax=Papilio polytes TaxID=76194 RepID=UPI000676A575|nr:PREDICTED: dnaJ homolog subfamily C member 10-like [Papilio polytes]